RFVRGLEIAAPRPMLHMVLRVDLLEGVIWPQLFNARSCGPVRVPRTTQSRAASTDNRRISQTSTANPGRTPMSLVRYAFDNVVADLCVLIDFRARRLSSGIGNPITRLISTL